MLKGSRFLLALSFAVPSVSQQIDWSKVNDEAMRNYQSLVQIDSTTTEVGVATFVKKTLDIEGFVFSLIGPLEILLGPLEIRSVTLGRGLVAGTCGFAALHHAPEQRLFAEVIQLLKFPLSSTERRT